MSSNNQVKSIVDPADLSVTAFIFNPIMVNMQSKVRQGSPSAEAAACSFASGW